MSWLSFPDLVAPHSKEKLEKAVQLSYYGYTQDSNDLFEALVDSDPSPALHYERATALVLRGYYVRAEAALEKTLTLIEPENSHSLFAFAAKLQYALVKTMARGHYRSAKEEAEEVRDEYRVWRWGRSDFTEPELEVIHRYYAIMSGIEALSNWVTSEDRYVLEESFQDERRKLREYSTLHCKTLLGCRILRAMQVLPLDDGTQLMVNIINNISEYWYGGTWTNRDNYFAANMILRVGIALCERSELGLARRCLNVSCEIIQALSRDPDLAIASLGPSPWTGRNNQLAAHIPWRHLFPRLAFQTLALEVKLSQERDPEQITRLADLAACMDDRAWETSYRIDARSLASSLYAETKDSSSLAVLESKNGDIKLMLRTFPDMGKQMQSMVLCMFGSRPDTVTDSFLYSECKRFLDNLDGFDSPFHLLSITLLLLGAAKSLGTPQAEIYEYQSNILRYMETIPKSIQEPRPQSPDRDLARDIRNDLDPGQASIEMSVREDIRTFEKCLEVLKVWASEQMRSGKLTEDRWAKTILAHVPDSDRANLLALDASELRQAILGSFGDEGHNQASDTFFAADAQAWLTWIASVHDWLAQIRNPEIEARCDWVLTKMIHARSQTERLHTIRTNFERVRSKAGAELYLLECQIHAEIVNSANPSALDREIARGNLANAMCDLAVNCGMNNECDKQEELLREAQSMSLAQAQPQDCIGWRMIQIGCLRTAVRACELRFKHLGKNQDVLDELFELFDRVDSCVRESHQLRFLFGSSDQLEKAGYTALQGSKAAAVLVEDSTAAPLELCADLIKGLRSRDDAQLSIGATQNDEERLVRRLTTWVQRSKGRAMMELLSENDLAEHDSLFNAESLDQVAKDLLRQERTLIVERDSADLQDRAAVVDALVKCRQQMLREPSLASITELRLATSASFDDIQVTLADYERSAVFIDWFEVGPEIWFHPHRESMPSKPLLIEGIDASHVLEWKKRYIERAGTPLDTEEAQEMLGSLELLIQPLAEITMPGETIILCPSRTTQGIPFQAILLNQAPLIERNPLIYVQSMAQARHALAQCRLHQQPVRNGALICPLKEDPSISEVPLAIAISSICGAPPAIGLSDLSAPLSKTSALAALQQNDTVTVLGHASFNAGAPMQSGFQLAGTSSGDSSSRISAADIFRAEVHQGAVVLQMGCQSGVSQVDATGTHLGLDAAFFFSGAASIVSTLWQILDRDAFDFIQTFYGVWKAESINARGDYVDLAVVMWKTVGELRLRKDRERAFHWAAFVLNGAWVGRKLSLSQ